MFSANAGSIASKIAPFSSSRDVPSAYTKRAGQRARRLGIELSPGPRGGPVFDATGRFAGMALGGAGEPDQLVPASTLRAEIGDVLGTATQLPDAPRMALDELYERALKMTVQVLAAP